MLYGVLIFFKNNIENFEDVEELNYYDFAPDSSDDRGSGMGWGKF